MTRKELAFKKGWAGFEKENSKAPWIGPMKLLELLQEDLNSPFAMSPVKNRGLSTGYMGGVRRRVEGFHLLTSGSAWDERADAMWALLLNYYMANAVKLHHVGFGHETKQAMLDSVRADEEKLSVKSINVPASDHDRYYWDVVTENPKVLLDFINHYLGCRMEFWGHHENSPVGVVWEDNNGVPLGIMSRRYWWNIK